MYLCKLVIAVFPGPGPLFSDILVSAVWCDLCLCDVVGCNSSSHFIAHIMTECFEIKIMEHIGGLVHIL